MLLGTMEVTSPISFASPKPHFSFTSPKPHFSFTLSSPSSSSSSSSSSSPSSPSFTSSLRLRFPPRPLTTLVASARSSLRLSSPLAVAETLEQAAAEASPSPPPPARGVQQRIDKSGRFSSPRAARELALLIAYAACLEGTDPVRLFDKRVNARREPGFVFDKASLLKYDHMCFGGAPVEVGTEEEAEELMLQNERDSANEAEVLSAPPKLVYNRFVLRFAREILEAVANGWDQHVLVINKITPQNWKDEPVARILELCILHLAMAEITAKGTRHQIVINEAVDLAKRFCDGGAPRIINGCLRTFVKDYSNTPTFRPSEPTP